jgi:hypothetical protein
LVDEPGQSGGIPLVPELKRFRLTNLRRRGESSRALVSLVEAALMSHSWTGRNSSAVRHFDATNTTPRTIKQIMIDQTLLRAIRDRSLPPPAFIVGLNDISPFQLISGASKVRPA